MRSIPTELNDELLKEANFMARLVEMDLSSPVYYTDLDIDIYYDSKQWLSRGLNFDTVEYSLSPQVDKTSFDIDNVSLEFSSIVLNEEIRGKKCGVRITALAGEATVIAEALIFQGLIDSYSITPRRAKLDVYNPLIFWQRKVPRRIHQPTCPWPFKMAGSPCGYGGAETECDHTYNRCAELTNTINFGGFRWLPQLQNKQIWWGKAPK